MAGPRSLILDFNGTLSHDEHIVLEIFQELFAEQGRPISTRSTYERELAGMSDPEIVWTWLGRRSSRRPAGDRRARPPLPGARRGRIDDPRRRCVRRCALPPSTCRSRSAPARPAAEIEPVVEAAGIAGCFRAVVSSDDVVHGKPDPEGYVKTLELLEAEPARAVVFEDTEAGIASARQPGSGACSRCARRSSRIASPRPTS